jgi:hypothetical protein
MKPRKSASNPQLGAPDRHSNVPLDFAKEPLQNPERRRGTTKELCGAPKVRCRFRSAAGYGKGALQRSKGLPDSAKRLGSTRSRAVVRQQGFPARQRVLGLSGGALQNAKGLWSSPEELR